MTGIWIVVEIAAKWAMYLGILGAAGTAICTTLFRLRDTRTTLIAFAILGIVGSAEFFAMKGAALTGDISGMTDPEMLGLLWSTQSGLSLKLQLGGLALCALGAVWMPISVVGGLVAIASLVVTGHIPAAENITLSVLHYIHLLAIAFWIGILFPLKRLASDQTAMGKAAQLGYDFGRIAVVMVPALIVAGLFMSYALLGSFDAILTGYGRILLIKVLFVSTLLGLAALNKLRLTPAMAKGDEQAAAMLVTSIRVEWMLMMLIIALTAILTTVLTLPT